MQARQMAQMQAAPPPRSQAPSALVARSGGGGGGFSETRSAPRPSPPSLLADDASLRSASGGALPFVKCAGQMPGPYSGSLRV